MSHICRDGGPGAPVTSMVGALNVWSCAVCGERGSDQPCQIGKSHGDATGLCRSCGRFTCAFHRSRYGNVCVTCQKKIALIKNAPPKGPRYGRWGRTGNLSG